MLVKFYGNLDRYEPVELFVGNIPQMLAGVQHVYGDELASVLLQDQHYYLLTKSSNDQDVVAIHPKMVMSDFADYDVLLVIPHIEGETGIETGIAIAAWLGATGAGATILGAVIAVAINVAISLALSYIVQLLSPTLQFDQDPAQAQKLDSSLFNGAPNLREQGGSVPLVFGDCHCGGVLISSGISSEEIHL